MTAAGKKTSFSAEEPAINRFKGAEEMQTDPDQAFLAFIDGWAAKQGRKFVVETFDGREAADLIDGMLVDDVWGWLLPNENTEKTDDRYGCIIWKLTDGVLSLSWRQE